MTGATDNLSREVEDARFLAKRWRAHYEEEATEKNRLQAENARLREVVEKVRAASFATELAGGAAVECDTLREITDQAPSPTAPETKPVVKVGVPDFIGDGPGQVMTHSEPEPRGEGATTVTLGFCSHHFKRCVHCGEQFNETEDSDVEDRGVGRE
jgi:hypothetical protein